MLRIGQLDKFANANGRISQRNRSYMRIQPDAYENSTGRISRDKRSQILERLFVPCEDSKKKKKDSKKKFFCYLCTKIN